jgi:hypothetical protein
MSIGNNLTYHVVLKSFFNDNAPWKPAKANLYGLSSKKILRGRALPPKKKAAEIICSFE